MSNSILLGKALGFAERIVRMYQFLCREKHEFVVSKQLLRCGTSIGANAAEAIEAVSKNDFLNKMFISLKECSETLYWIELLHRTDYLTDAQYMSIRSDCIELKKMLTSITKTTRRNIRSDEH